MKKYKLHNELKGWTEIFESKQEAVKYMMVFIEVINEGMDANDEGYITPFDFTLEEIDCKEINEVITTYEEAKKYLIEKPNDDVANLVSEVNPKHIKALIAFNRLCTIAQAWNKADGFEPDFSNASQYKYFPWFVYDNGPAGFVYASTSSTATSASANFGSLLCFKTRERAIQFGKQFIDLWNDVFLFR